jgi:hypothetical protein
VSVSRFRPRLTAALRAVRIRRLIVLLLISGVAGLASDWLREERVIFPAPLPKFNQVPATR